MLLTSTLEGYLKGRASEIKSTKGGRPGLDAEGIAVVVQRNPSEISLLGAGDDLDPIPAANEGGGAEEGPGGVEEPLGVVEGESAEAGGGVEEEGGGGMRGLWNLLLGPVEKRLEGGFQSGDVVEELVEAGLGLHAVVGAGADGVGAEAVFEGVDGDGEVGVGAVVDLGLVDVDAGAGAAAVENDVVFGGGVGAGVEGVEEGEQEEEQEGEEEDQEEASPARRGFGFGERGGGEGGRIDVVVAVGGEILEGGGDTEVAVGVGVGVGGWVLVLVLVLFAKDHVSWRGDLLR